MSGNLKQELSEVAQWVELTVRLIVDHPDEVVLTEITGTHSNILELVVHRSDIGKVVGKRGVHADAIRRIMHAAGGARRKRYVLEIMD